MVSRYSAYRRGPDVISPDVIDRILVGACAAVWLVFTGVSVAATVALMDLGRGFHEMAGNPHTTWVLYAVIVVSALVIVGAIPVLLRARRMAEAEPATRPTGASVRGGRSIGSGHPAKRAVAESAPVQHADAFEVAAEWSSEAVDRIWLRGTVVLTSAIGIALIAVAAATYLMAVGHDGPSWISYGLAGVVTAGMPVIEWLYARQLRRVVAPQSS